MTRSNRHGQKTPAPQSHAQVKAESSYQGEMNAHLPERFRVLSSGFAAERDSGAIQRIKITVPLDDAIENYFREGSATTGTHIPKWRQYSEIPTMRELLAPISVLLSDDGTDGFSGSVPIESSLTDGDGEDDEDEDEIDDIDSQEPYLLKAFNRAQGAWPSKEKYIRTHYKLLREEALRPLRLAIWKLSRFPTAHEDSMENTIGLYDDVSIKGFTLATRGLAVKVSFSLMRVGKKIQWQQSKRLISGSLVVLIPVDGKIHSFDQLKVATIAARPLPEVNKEIPEVSLFFAHPNEIEIDCRKKWLMVEERSGFFEAERHTLSALQKMMTENSPLMEYLVDAKQEVHVPPYLQKAPFRNLMPVFEGQAQPGLMDVLHDWPADPITPMDYSQQCALRAMCVQSLAAIQGPPGTGKTFTSVEAIKIFLANMTKGDDPPIIVTCQTNHALDQLLVHISKIEQDAFVRLGGRSKDKETIIPRTLFNLRDGFQTPRSRTLGSASKVLRGLTKDISRILEPLTKDSEQRIGLVKLEELGILSREQCASVEDSVSQWVTAGKSGDDGDLLRKWAATAVNPPEIQTPIPIFDDYEPADLESEELREEEAEKVVQDDDEICELIGDYVSFEDDLVGSSNTANLLARTEDGKTRSFKSVKVLLDATGDLTRVNTKSRGIIFNYLLGQAKEVIRQQLVPRFEQYQQAARRRQIGRWEEDSCLLRHHKVVGLTTTGFSKYRALIASVRPHVVLVEEAAEALEAPVIATCVESLQHLILVGDHKQLRPSVGVRELQDSPYYLNISLFERLANNNHPVVQLQNQRRMIPPIRRLLQPIYGDIIKDHIFVTDKKNRPPVPGMGKRSTWFFHHDWIETRDEQMSCVNEFEARMVAGFVRYLFLNGTPTKNMTILTFYNGQRRHLLRLLRQDQIFGLHMRGIKVVTVDSYQGEENGIVLLSLVRSNVNNSIGFLENVNRACVAMSRAQRGFYMFGNMELLCSESKIWSDICKLLLGDETNPRRIGFTLPLTCTSHKRRIWMIAPDDWRSNSGGCELRCGDHLPCGHPCDDWCHPYPHVDCDQCTRGMHITPGQSPARSGQSSLRTSSQRTSPQRPQIQHRRQQSQLSSHSGQSQEQWHRFAQGGAKQSDRHQEEGREQKHSQNLLQQLDKENQDLLFADRPDPTSTLTSLDAPGEEISSTAGGRLTMRARLLFPSPANYRDEEWRQQVSLLDIQDDLSAPGNNLLGDATDHVEDLIDLS